MHLEKIMTLYICIQKVIFMKYILIEKIFQQVKAH